MYIICIALATTFMIPLGCMAREFISQLHRKATDERVYFGSNSAQATSSTPAIYSQALCTKSNGLAIIAEPPKSEGYAMHDPI